MLFIIVLIVPIGHELDEILVVVALPFEWHGETGMNTYC